MFDMERLKWIECRVYIDGDTRIDDRHFHYDSLHHNFIGYRQAHSINAVYDSEYYLEQFQGNRVKQKKVMWMRKRVLASSEERDKHLYLNEGFYLFGGIDQKGNTMNDLWLIEPYYRDNEKVLSPNTCDYLTSKPFLSVNIRRIDDYSGKPPCPRISHGSTIFKDWNKHYYLVIYGGRNDGIFSKT